MRTKIVGFRFTSIIPVLERDLSWGGLGLSVLWRPAAQSAVHGLLKRPREVINVDWGDNTYLYLIATTANMPPTRDLLHELQRGGVPQGKWCIVRIPRESISE